MTKLICGVALVCVLIAVVNCTRPSSSEATFLVQRHNYGRANPHPPSDGPINQISYQATTSNGLASMEDVASNYADNCVLAHNPNRGAGFPSGYYVGENIAAFAWSGSTPSNTTQGFLGQAYDFWYGEYVNFYFDSNGRGQCVSGTTCGHYTQVNWNNTLNVGCGYHYCNGGSIAGNWIFIVCNYLQAGNFNGYDAYRQGSGSSSCTPSCPANACGTVTSCGQSIQCSCSSGQYCTAANTCSACPNPCSANSCGSVFDPTCGVNVNCGSCSSGNQCTNSICVAPTPTATPTSAASASNSPAPSNSPAASASNSPAPSSSSAASATSTPAPASESNTPAASNSPAASESNSPAPSASASPAPVCDPASQCANLGWSCGAVSLCGQSYSCGGCGSGEQCNNGNCEQIPCGGSCGLNEQCSSNQCVCVDGFTLVNGQCQAPSMPGSIDYSRDFQTTLGPANGWTIPDTELNIVYAQNQVIEWVPAKAVVDEYNTKVTVDLTITGGDFGVAFRKGQNHGGTYYPNDMFLFSYRNVGTASEAIYVDLYVEGQLTEWGPWNGLTLATGAGQVNHLEFILSRNDQQNTIDVTLNYARDGYTSQFVASVYADSFPDVGGVAFSFNPTSGSYPSITNTLLATSTTLEVSLYQCLDTNAWTQLFYQATGANPATTTVQARASGQNANCNKAAMAGMEVASSMTVVVSSSTISSKALTSSFMAAVQSGNPALAPLAIESASVVPGTQGAIAAGVPIGASQIPILSAGGAGAAGGSGLSGGAIAGIVVGSVAGAVLAVGLATAVIVAVVVVAAVVIAKGRSSEEDSNDVEVPTRAPESNRTFRQTIVGLFRPRGGVDVMNGGGKGHQSITARAPAMS